MQLGLASGAVVVGGLLWKRSQDHGVAGTAPVVPAHAPNVESAPLRLSWTPRRRWSVTTSMRMLPSYLAGTLPTGRRERIDRHLRTCEHRTQDLRGCGRGGTRESLAARSAAGGLRGRQRCGATAVFLGDFGKDDFARVFGFRTKVAGSPAVSPASFQRSPYAFVNAWVRIEQEREVAGDLSSSQELPSPCPPGHPREPG